jgi:hypothetical protein
MKPCAIGIANSGRRMQTSCVAGGPDRVTSGTWTCAVSLIRRSVPYSDTYMNMLSNTKICGHVNRSIPLSLMTPKPPILHGQIWVAPESGVVDPM